MIEWAYNRNFMVWKKNENRAPSWAVAAKISPGARPGPRLWHLPGLLTFIRKYVYLDNSGALKDFRIFFMETLGWMFEFSFVK